MGNSSRQLNYRESLPLHLERIDLIFPIHDESSLVLKTAVPGDPAQNPAVPVDLLQNPAISGDLVQNPAVPGDRHDLPRDEFTAASERVLCRPLESAAAWDLHADDILALYDPSTDEEADRYWAKIYGAIFFKM